jgi:hypothetical protein
MANFISIDPTADSIGPILIAVCVERGRYVRSFSPKVIDDYFPIEENGLCRKERLKQALALYEETNDPRELLASPFWRAGAKIATQVS